MRKGRQDVWVRSSQKEIGDGATGDWRGGGGEGEGCVDLSQGNWERETGRLGRIEKMKVEKTKKYVVRSSSQKERKKEIEDGATVDWRGGGGDDDNCVGLSQGKGDGETREEADEKTKKYLYF